MVITYNNNHTKLYKNTHIFIPPPFKKEAIPPPPLFKKEAIKHNSQFIKKTHIPSHILQVKWHKLNWKTASDDDVWDEVEFNDDGMITR